MALSEWVREQCFWMMDFLKGSPVRKHYQDIRTILENRLDPEVSKKHEAYLNAMLKYATESVPYYQRYRGYRSLDSFPLINKSIIKEEFDSFQSPKFKGEKLHKMYTSGSTGTPFMVNQDQNKRNRVYAEMIYYWQRAGYQIGMRYIFYRIWIPLTRKSRFTTLARNLIMWDIQILDNENLENIRTKLKSDQKIKMMLGYASTHDTIANHLIACGDTPDMFHIKTILSGSELLSECTREKLMKVFNCPVVSIYQNQENGLLAAECIEKREFHVNSASYHIELLKFDSNEPVEIGEPGRVVVTDLFNYAMPLIRYDTGDVGIWKKEADCNWNSLIFSSIQGRLADFVYDTSGKKMSPYAIATFLCTFDKINQFQFIQQGEKQFVLRLNGAKGNYEDIRFIELFKRVMGQDAEIIVEHVVEFPVLKSGKRKEVICNFKK